MNREESRDEILRLVAEHCRQFHGAAEFVPGRTKVNYAGRVYGPEEMVNLVDAALEFVLTAAGYARQLEERLRGYFDARRYFLVNSGSSANLLMAAALRSAQFERQLDPGDEIITPAVTFPTTLTPIVQNGLVPVFVDCEVGTYNVDPNLLEDAVGPRTRALFLPHTLGNPCHMEAVMEVVRRRDLVLLEDGCDALGATWRGRLVGTFGAMSSNSFYPAHQMTLGEGGGVVVNDPRFVQIVRSLRDWGRDCWCEPGRNDTCGDRFTRQHGELPFGYDHKYVYSNLGYNLKVTDLQAAVGLAQFERLPSFVAARRENFRFFYDLLYPYADRFALPRWEEGAEPSWFGFPLTMRDAADADRLVRHLEGAMIETRKVFAGNVLKQPAFRGIAHRVHGGLSRTDTIMENALFFGVYPGLTPAMREFVAERLLAFFRPSSR